MHSISKNEILTEMRAAGMLRHPNIVEVYDAGVAEESDYFIAMEYVAGGETLESLGRAGVFPKVETVADVIFQCPEALDYAHRKGVIHRDIKPSNILLTEEGTVKIGDFSAALLTDPDIADTQVMDTIGSPLYMSPEQIREESVTNQTDLFALGIVMYELLTGQHPFEAQTFAGLTHRILNETPQPIERLRPDVPAPLVRIVDRALAKGKEQRYQSALELAADLSQAFSELTHPLDGITTESRVDLLKQTRFFEEFHDAEVWELLRRAEWEDYGDGETIIRETERGDTFYIVASGTVNVVKGDRLIAQLCAGECFGEMAYLVKSERTATVVAAGEVATIKMNAASIASATLRCQSQFHRVFIRTLIARLAATTAKLQTEPLSDQRCSKIPIMSGNTFGKLFTVTTFGESHGVAIGCVVDGCPPNLALNEGDIQPDLERRRPGKTRHTTQRRELDQVKLLSGVFEGKTTGTPIALMIENLDQKSKDYSKIKDQFRPAHADYTYLQKYGVRDYRGGGRASARETAVRVAAGAIAKKYLKERCGIQIRGYLAQLGPLAPSAFEWEEVERNPFFCPDAALVPRLESFMDALRKEGDSIGARVTVMATGVPPGLGEPVFDKLDADIASALMGINAVKGVEIGAGFSVVGQKGTEHRDELSPDGFLSNNAGGTLGGISSGQDIVASVALKPTSSLRLPGRSVDVHGNPVEVVTHGRHDPCVGIRATPIVEAMLALVLMDHFLRHRAQNADVDSGVKIIPAAPE